MTSRHALADVAALVGEPSRAAMLLALLDGVALPAGELARVAGLSASAASLHLAKLAQGGLVSMRRESRHRYYALASADVAHALEALGVIARAAPPARVRPVHEPIRVARTCYDHLAGQLAVALWAMLEREKFISAQAPRALEVTEEGARFFARTFAVDVTELAEQRRALMRACLDLTERKHHLAGSLGAALLASMLQRRWLSKRRDSRGLRITPEGERGFRRLGVLVSAT